jgi:hypothetical protein
MITDLELFSILFNKLILVYTGIILVSLYWYWQLLNNADDRTDSREVESCTGEPDHKSWGNLEEKITFLKGGTVVRNLKYGANHIFPIIFLKFVSKNNPFESLTFTYKENM